MAVVQGRVQETAARSLGLCKGRQQFVKPFGKVWFTAHDTRHSCSVVTAEQTRFITQQSTSKSLADYCNNDNNNNVSLQLCAHNGCGGCSSVGTVSEHHAADTSLIPRCGEGFRSPESTFSAHSLSVSVHPCVQSHALTSARTLQIL